MLNSNIRTILNKRVPKLLSITRQIKAKTWPKGSIVYYIGKRKEPLTPESLKSGASGSYTAVIKLCQQWVKLGYQVTVYSTCNGQAATYDGVEYVDYYKFNPYDKFDIFIIFQHPYLLPLPIQGRKICLDWHDILGSDRVFPEAKLKKFDLIFAKSQFQRQLMPFIEDNKFVIVTNGIDKSIAALNSENKYPYRLIYASRYYRGLDSMLTYGWPLIKQAIPEAELHIYYGFVKLELSDLKAVWREKMLKLMQQPGIVEHGKVGQDQLILAKSQASIHYYACTYQEIDCISIRESAMVGCVPVTTDFAVFSEKNYCVKVPGKPEAPATQAAVANKVIELLKNPQLLADYRQQFQLNVRLETWDNIAKVWAEKFK